MHSPCVGTRNRANLAGALGNLLEGDGASSRLQALDPHLKVLGKLALLVA